jgi:hyperosmotically inducible periplasmic protein
MKPQNPSQRPVGRVASVLAISALALGLAACGKKEEPAAPRVEPAAEQPAPVASAAQAPASAVEPSAAAGQAPAAPPAGGGMVFLDDAGMTALVKTTLAADPELSAAKIDVSAANGRVTLKGAAPSAAAAERAVTMVRGITGVTSVNNQLTVSGS